MSLAARAEAATFARSSRGYRRGDQGYRDITLALFAAGMATFVAMYAAQAVLPDLTTQFTVGPATAALAVSATTGFVAFAIIPGSALSERFGRVRVMAIAALASALLGCLVPLAPSMEVLVVLRALQGIALAGVPATAMAYLAEEVDPEHLGGAMGKYIAGNTIGGLSGRLLASFALDHGSWRIALEVVAVTALGFTGLFLWRAPKSRFFRPAPVGLRATTRNLTGHLGNARLVALYLTAFLLMGGFVAVYNMLGFRLLAAPFDLPKAIVGLVFLLYLAGTVSSAMAGRLADRFGRKQVMVAGEMVTLAGLLLTMPGSLPFVVVGVALFTAGFFAAHSVASGWVGVIATEHRAEASALYLFSYYAGSSVLGACSGLFFTSAGWNGVVTYVGVLCAAAIALAALMPLLRRRRATP